jgi:CAP-Gly domain-containing linker protein 2
MVILIWNFEICFIQYREESEAKLLDIQDLLSRLEKEKGELTSQLEDERRKVEDLQFRFEEEAITKCDIQV